MLYKKYHRNYISQFRKGTEFWFKAYYREKVVIEPYVYSGVCRSGSWVLIFLDGKINYNIKIEKDVI